ncbi:MAG: hypothetical protein KDK33_03150 [Leptospiraceae bacterium]|nr:hypothetical protein [Leptospiraceae bacterium]
MGRDEVQSREADAASVPDDIKLEYHLTTTTQPSNNTAFCAVMSGGFFPYIDSEISTVTYYATDGGGYRRRVLDFRYERQSYMSPWALFAMPLIPFSSDIKFFELMDSIDPTEVHMRAEAALPVVLGSDQVKEFREEARAVQQREEAIFVRLKQEPGSWLDLRNFASRTTYPAVAREAKELLEKEWKSWLFFTVKNEFDLNPMADVYWESGEKWGQLGTMFHSTLARRHDRIGSNVAVVEPKDCARKQPVAVSHCILFHYGDHADAVFLLKKGKSFYLTGVALNKDLIPNEWERPLANLLERLSRRPRDWKLASDPKLLEWRIATRSADPFVQ